MTKQRINLFAWMVLAKNTTGRELKESKLTALNTQVKKKYESEKKSRLLQYHVCKGSVKKSFLGSRPHRKVWIFAKCSDCLK